MAEGDQTNQAPAGQPAPGQVVAPGGAPAPAPVQPPVSPAEQPQPPAQQAPAPLAQATPQTPEDDAPFMPAAATAPGQPTGTADAISWTASEFIAHDKSTSWYLGLVAITVMIAAFVFLVTRDKISTLVVFVGAFAFGSLGARKPKQLQYQMDGTGVTIGPKYYDFGSFRSFSVVPEGAFSSIVFMPLKRFAPLLTIYYDPKDERRIVGLISSRLPFEEHKADPVDKLMRNVRF